MLRSLAAVWFCSQIVGLAASPTVLCLEASHAAAAVECTCGHEGATECPMHHHATTKSTSKSNCACRSTTDPDAAVLRSLLGPTAVMPDVSPHSVPLFSSAFHPISVLQPLSPFGVPDGPPPRA
jgi:hypothetical protein